MASKTTNFNLHKIDLTDAPPDITVLNQNWDTIDAELNKRPTLDEDGKIPSSQLPSMDYIPTSEKGKASGVATLGTDGKVPSGQLPSMNYVPTSRTVNGKALSSDISLTASDVGLGNVPNVTTNNQTPTYTQASSLANIVSGEKLSTTMGKIMKAIADLISHLSNKSNPHDVTAAQISAVPTSRTVNGKALSSNITLSASDVSARPSTWTPSASDVGAVPTSRTVNSKALSSNITLSASDVGAVPTSRTVNGKALSSNISLTASDVSARPSTWTPTASDVGAVPANQDITIQKSGVAYDSLFGQGTRNVLMRVRNVAGNANNQRTLALFDSTQRSDIETALRLYDVTSGTEKIYSIFGEHNLDKLATSLGAAKIASGSYTGAGTSGSSNKNTLTFDFKPKVVFIGSNASGTSTSSYQPIPMVQGAAYTSSFGTTSTRKTITLSWSGNSVSWYSDGASQQLNASTLTYYWIAIG